MTPVMTRAQERRLYRIAVQASLEAFYGKSKQEATRLVRDWWTRLASGDSLDSDLLLHAEPMNTAAGLAQARVIPITSENRDRYHQILNRSRDVALSRGKALTTKIKSKKTEDKHQVAFG